MNCRQVQSLVSPYLDQRLSGRMMLDLEAHFQSCPVCERERRAVQQVRMALRALPVYIPRQTLEARMVMDAARRDPLLFSTHGAAARPYQRGRRLAHALALSGVGLLTLSAPFAPAAFDGAERFSHLREARARASAVPGTVFVVEQNSASLPGMTLVRLSEPGPTPAYTPAVALAAGSHVPQPASLPLSVWSATATLPSPSDLSLTAYRTR